MFLKSDARHHHHQHINIVNLESPNPSINDQKTPTRLLARSTTSCVTNTEFGKCALPTQTQVLPIVLGVTIPLLAAFCVLVYLHFRHLKRLKLEELADKDIDVDMDDYDTTLDNNNNPIAPGPPSTEKFNRYPDQHSVRRGSMETSHSINPENPFYARAPYMMHPELSNSKHSLDEYSRSLHSIMDSNIYPSNASVYSSHSGGGVSRPLSPKFPHPVHRLNNSSNLAISPPQPRISASSGESYISSERTEKGASTSPPSTVAAYSPDPMQNKQLGEQISAALPAPPQRTYQRESKIEDQDFSRDSIRYSKDFNTRAIHVEEETNNFSFEEDEGENSNPKTDLDRSVTKQFERVKSIYREYLPESLENSPELKPTEGDEVPEINPFGKEPNQEQHQSNETEEEYEQHEQYEEQYQEHEKYEQDEEQYQKSDHEEQYEQSQDSYEQDPYPEQHAQPHYRSHSQSPSQQYQHSQSPSQQYQSHSQTPSQHYQHSQSPSQQYQSHSQTPSQHYQHTQSPSQQYQSHTQTPSQHYQHSQTPSQHHQHSQTPSQHYQSPSQTPSQHYQSHSQSHVYYQPKDHYTTSPPFSPYEQGSDGPFQRPYAASPSPSLSVTPLTDLAELPVPHNLIENDSPLAYAPQRRHHNKGAASPIPAYNPLYMNGDEATSLPSPHELRKSVALMTFTPPKKYVGAGSTPSSSRSGSLTSSSTGQLQQFVPTPKARPFSQLVPDAKDTQMLRPQMNMR